MNFDVLATISVELRGKNAKLMVFSSEKRSVETIQYDELGEQQKTQHGAC